MASRKEIEGKLRLKRGQQYQITAKTKGGVTRIGTRDPNTGLHEVIQSDGSSTPTGIRTFNTGVASNQVIRATPSGSLMALDWRNSVIQAESITPEATIFPFKFLALQNNKYFVVAGSGEAYELKTNFYQTDPDFIQLFNIGIERTQWMIQAVVIKDFASEQNLITETTNGIYGFNDLPTIQSSLSYAPSTNWVAIGYGLFIKSYFLGFDSITSGTIGTFFPKYTLFATNPGIAIVTSEKQEINENTISIGEYIEFGVFQSGQSFVAPNISKSDIYNYSGIRGNLRYPVIHPIEVTAKTHRILAINAELDKTIYTENTYSSATHNDGIGDLSIVDQEIKFFLYENGSEPELNSKQNFFYLIKGEYPFSDAQIGEVLVVEIDIIPSNSTFIPTFFLSPLSYESSDFRYGFQAYERTKEILQGAKAIIRVPVEGEKNKTRQIFVEVIGSEWESGLNSEVRGIIYQTETLKSLNVKVIAIEYIPFDSFRLFEIEQVASRGAIYSATGSIRDLFSFAYINSLNITFSKNMLYVTRSPASFPSVWHVEEWEIIENKLERTGRFLSGPLKLPPDFTYYGKISYFPL